MTGNFVCKKTKNFDNHNFARQVMNSPACHSNRAWK